MLLIASDFRFRGCSYPGPLLQVATCFFAILVAVDSVAPGTAGGFPSAWPSSSCAAVSTEDMALRSSAPPRSRLATDSGEGDLMVQSLHTIPRAPGFCEPLFTSEAPRFLLLQPWLPSPVPASPASVRAEQLLYVLTVSEHQHVHRHPVLLPLIWRCRD